MGGGGRVGYVGQGSFVIFLFWPSLGEHLFDPQLWTIFQSSLHTLQITFSFMLAFLKIAIKESLYVTWLQS